MSKKDREVQVTLGIASQVYDTDWNGRMIEDAADVLAKLPCTMDIDDKRRVAFCIVASSPKAPIKESDDKHVGDRLGFLTRKVMGAYLADSTDIDLFKTHRIQLAPYFDKRLHKTPQESSEYLAPFTCKITDDAFESVNAQYDEYSAARNSFDHAVEKLRDFADLSPYGFTCHRSEILSLLAFIERTLEAADVGHLYLWYNEKQSGIRRYFNDLFRRKQANHSGYRRAQDYIRSNLFSYHAPDCWRDHPPLLQAAESDT